MSIIGWIQAAVTIINFIKGLIAAGKLAELQLWLRNVDKTTSAMKEAKTPEQKYDVAKSMVSLIGAHPIP